MKENINKLKEKIIASNPSILELEFGCDVFAYDEEMICLAEYLPTKNYTKNEFTCKFLKKNGDTLHLTKADIREKQERGTFKIIGRPITLEDVIFTVRKRGWTYNEMKDLLTIWKYGKDFDNQSPEFYNFLTEILL